MDPIKPISDTNSSNHHKFLKLSAKAHIPEYKYNKHKNSSLFAQNKLRIHSSKGHLTNSISAILRTRAEKSTWTKARVIFLYNSLSNTTHLLTHRSSNTETTPSISKIRKMLLAILTGKDAILKEVRDCVLLNDEDTLQENSPYIYSYWRDLNVKHGCLFIDQRIAIRKAIKEVVLEDIHSTHPGSFTMLSLAQNIWWPYIHEIY